MMPHGRVSGLDALRAAAALTVVGIHGAAFYIRFVGDVRPLYFAAGFGVDVFFVLCGFLAGGALIESSKPGFDTVTSFWVRRAWRIVPGYLLFLPLYLVLARLADGAWPDGWRHLGFVQNLAWMPPAFFPEAWCLSIEVWFLLIVPLACVLFGVSGERPHRLLLVAVVAIVIGWIARAAWVIGTDAPLDEGVRKIVLARIDAPAWGLAMAAFWRIRRDLCIVWRGALAALGVVLVAGSAVWTLTGDPAQGPWLRVMVFALNGLGCALWLPWLMTVELPSALVALTSRLARWSFAWFLVHGVVLRLWLGWSGVPLPERPVAAAAAWLAYLAVSIGAAALIHRLLERPLLAWRDRRFSAASG